jgi:hypothetical protein
MLVALVASPHAVEATPVTARILIHSEPGDPIGGDRDYLFEVPRDGSLTSVGADTPRFGLPGNGLVDDVRFGFFVTDPISIISIEFGTGTVSRDITPGDYPNASSSNLTGRPQLEVVVGGLGPLAGHGRFTIIETVFDSHFLTQM